MKQGFLLYFSSSNINFNKLYRANKVNVLTKQFLQVPGAA